MIFIDPDERFFQEHPDRKTHIRMPRPVLVKNTQRATYFEEECRGEFWSLGDHDKKRRRILLTRVDFNGKPLPDNKVLKVPFLAFSDESIEDSDAVLLPLIEGIMADAVSRMR